MVKTYETDTSKLDSMQVLIADDHWVVRESLKQVTKQLNKNFKPVEASNFQEVMHILEKNPKIGLMLIDLIMPGFHEFEGLEVLRTKYPDIPVVVISIHEDHEHVVKAISYGVIGYIPKSADAQEIIHSLTRVISGEVSFPRSIIQNSVRSRTDQIAASQEISRDQTDALSSLTVRERDVLALIGKGMPVSRIATSLEISPQTVRVHLGNAMKKLNVKNREEAIRFAVNHAHLLGSGD